MLLRLHACMKVLAGTLLADLLAADRVYRALAEKVQGHFWRLVWLQSRAHDRDHHSARNCESKHSNLLLYYSLTSFVNINMMQNFHLYTFENTRMKYKVIYINHICNCATTAATIEGHFSKF